MKTTSRLINQQIMLPLSHPSCRGAAQFNQCVQATPDYALLFIVAQVSGAPDAVR